MGKTVQVTGFPSHVTVDALKRFVETYIGEGTIYAIKIRPSARSGGWPYAIVQFNTVRDADKMVSLSQTIYYGSKYIKARMMDNDIVPKPRTSLHTMEHITLHFGSQISKDGFSVLWTGKDVTIKFGHGMRKWHFYLCHHDNSYKLDLPYENIWQIELHRPRGRNLKYLVIQLYGAPRIFEKEVRNSFNIYDDPRFNYYVDGSEDVWIRTTDFTRSCIGHSSALCLELPADLQLPDFQENFAYYNETDGLFVLEKGSTFSCNLDLVPIVGPPAGVELLYEILFKVNLLVQNGCVPGSALDAKFFKLIDHTRINIVLIEHALEKLYHLKDCCYEPSRWLDEQFRKYLASKIRPGSHRITLDAGLVYVHRVQITPCKVYFCGPEINVSNRVLREFLEYIDNFLRVSFVDEELEQLYSTDVSSRSSLGNTSGRTAIYKRILSTLQNGIVIGNKRFEFLAFSSSQLRENSCWMFAPSDGLTAADIRKWMGNFGNIRNVAKYAARLGQSFGSSVETLSVDHHEIEIIPDIKIERGGTTYVFSDGIGKISAEFAKKVAKKCDFQGNYPSAFQIRYGGYKGVVAVDPTSMKKLSLRKSMCKYESENVKLDVLAYSKRQPCFLNRQIITLLSTLGVADHAFEQKQRIALDQLNSILEDPLKALDALDLMSPGEITNIVREMLLCGYRPGSEPFLTMILHTFRASKLLDLRTKARIFIPDGRSMMGCLDETRTLEYGEVFVQISDTKQRQLYDSCGTSSSSGSEQRYIVKGEVVVAKNPCLHPGDVRVLRAVNVPGLHHMVDCVVFPQKGERPHPNECSGSDLDGDIYFVCWDDDLIPRRKIPPMDYNPQPTVELDHEVTMEEVQEYFTNYIVNDSLGIISNAHTVFADREETKAMSSSCLQLAKKFSIAVDFPKTGVPAELPPELRVREFPDFMEKPDKPTYVSKNVIGKLFREVKDMSPSPSSIQSFTKEMAIRSYDPVLEVDGFEDYLDDAFYYKSSYDYKLGNLMDYYGIRTEPEILSGGIMKLSKSFTKRRDAAEAIGIAVKSLRKEARSWFKEKKSTADSSDSEDIYAKASAWYYVTYHPSYWGCYNEGMKRDHYLSFPWCVYDKLIQIKKKKLNQNAEISSLVHDFGRLTAGA